MKLTNEQVYNSAEALNVLLSEKMSPRLALKLKRIRDPLIVEATRVQDARNELIRLHGNQVEDSEEWEITSPFEFASELQALLKDVVDITLPTITVSDIETLQLPYGVVDTLADSGILVDDECAY